MKPHERRERHDLALIASCAEVMTCFIARLDKALEEPSVVISEECDNLTSHDEIHFARDFAISVLCRAACRMAEPLTRPDEYGGPA